LFPQVLVQAVSRRIDPSAGNLMRVILNLMNESVPWAAVSNTLSQMDIFQRVRNAEMTSAIGSDGRLQVQGSIFRNSSLAEKFSAKFFIV
jgi:hypothetical protein